MSDNKNFSEENMPTVKLSDIKRMIDSLEKDGNEQDFELSFEFVLIALFPDCWNNVKAELSRQYTLGYIDGYSEEKTTNCSYGSSSDDVDCYCE